MLKLHKRRCSQCQDSSLLKRTPDSTGKRGKTEGITTKKEKRHEETILCHPRRPRPDSLLFRDKTYTWTEAHVFPIFASSQTADDEKSLSIIKTEDGMLELVSFENKTVYGTLTDIKDGKATVAGVEIAITEDASILTVGGFTYNG